MLKDKRERFVASAQVAFHYSAYTLKEALALSRSERQLLLAVVVAEEERASKRVETMLGIRWPLEDLIADAGAASSAGGSIPHTVRVPFLPMLAPEMFKSMTEEYKRKYKKLIEGAAPGTVLVDVGTLSTEEAKDFFKSMG